MKVPRGRDISPHSASLKPLCASVHPRWKGQRKTALGALGTGSWGQKDPACGRDDAWVTPTLEGGNGVSLCPCSAPPQHSSWWAEARACSERKGTTLRAWRSLRAEQPSGPSAALPAASADALPVPRWALRPALLLPETLFLRAPTVGPVHQPAGQARSPQPLPSPGAAPARRAPSRTARPAPETRRGARREAHTAPVGRCQGWRRAGVPVPSSGTSGKGCRHRAGACGVRPAQEGTPEGFLEEAGSRLLPAGRAGSSGVLGPSRGCPKQLALGGPAGISVRPGAREPVTQEGKEWLSPAPAAAAP